jgi:hypothetical protein
VCAKKGTRWPASGRRRPLTGTSSLLSFAQRIIAGFAQPLDSDPDARWSAATRHPASFIASDFPLYPRHIVLN